MAQTCSLVGKKKKEALAEILDKAPSGIGLSSTHS